MHFEPNIQTVFPFVEDGIVREVEGKKHKTKETKRWQDIVKEQDEDDPEVKAYIICSL